MPPAKVALVTGASQGIGAASSRALVEAGWHVVLASRRADELHALAAELGEGTATVAVCDVSAPDAVEAMFTRIRERFERIDVVFNNAGVNAGAAEIGDIAWEDWRRVLGVNLDGAFLVARGAFRMMRSQRPRGGRIINNGSVSAYTPRMNSAAYTASKHAISGLTKAIALDGRDHDIACAQIDVGNAATAFTERMSEGALQADGSRRVEPRMDVDHVAAAVVQMAQLPLEANIPSMTIMATKMPFIGRG